jgi:CHAT domain-containing protein
LAIALINLGRAQLERHRHDAALAYLERAAGLERVTMRIRALAFTNAGLCYARLGDYERAIAMQRRAVEAQENGQPALLSHALGELGITYFFMGRDQEAITHLTRALQVAKQAGIDNFIQAWTANLAWGYIRLGQWDNADEFNQWSHKLNQAARSSERLVFNALYGGEIAEGRKRYNEARAQYAMVIKEPGKDPLNKSDAHAGLARVHLADGQPQFAARQFEAALDVIEKTQTSLVKTDYKITYLTRLTNVYGQYIDMLVGQRQHDRALEIADSSRARVLAERHGVAAGRKHTAREFKRIAAQSGSTLLQYWIGEKRSYAWAVTGSDIVSIELPKAAEIEALVRTYQTTIVNSLADPLQSTSTAGDKLYAMLVAPFARVLKPGSSVIVVPDGPLTRVNFETLPVDGPGRHYWIEDVSLSVAPSLGTLAASTPRNASSDRASVLLIGDPAPTDPEFPQLRHARTEIDAVANAFPKAEKAIYRGQEASPHAFRQARPERFGLIHFTAHASANAMSPLDSAVILSRDATGYKLYARDVAEQKLNAELVTISACRSAGDRTYSGEGLVGFAWAFLRAGAERVLAGLWDVDDRSTAELMTMVYAGLARGESPAAALRAAKRALIARGGPSAKPYYWGPFQLIVATP